MLLAYMPFHIFWSQWLSTLTSGLSVWKVWKDVLAMLLVVLSVGLVIRYKAYRGTPYMLLVGFSLAYTLLHIVLYLLNKDTSMQIAALATVYNSRLFWYLIIGMSAVLLLPKQLNYHKVLKVLIIVSTVVACLGILQYLLPKDIMTHFGYSLERGARPAFFIDDKPDLPRIMSTIRDPNSLGAFLIMPITILWAYLITNKNKYRWQLIVGLLGIHLLALFLTFSRGATGGAIISLAIVTIYLKKDLLISLIKRFWPLITALMLIGIIGAYLLRDQYIIQNIIFHSDENTVSELDSNEYHLSFAQKGLEGIADEPLGHGPGTAGIVSIQNSNGGLLTENYFIQIGYEVGLIGLVIFLAVLAFMQKKLFRVQGNLPAALWATFWGYIAIAMLFHIWTNEAVAAQWWLLAGLAIGLPQSVTKK